MKFEAIPRFSLPVQCEAVRKAESITIKNGVLLRRLNEKRILQKQPGSALGVTQGAG